jgi:DNA repair protein RadC
MDPSNSIKLWSPDDRPREKLLEKGAHSLSDAELMAILIGSGNRNETSVELARRILSSVGNNLDQLGKLNLSDLKQFKGMGDVKSLILLAAMELGKRRRSTEVKAKARITCSADAYERFLEPMSDLMHEEFWLICTNRAQQVLATRKVSEGGLSATVADPKKIFRIALEHNASSIIVGHNHPSGEVKPSTQDDQLTWRLRNAGKMLDCALLDHIIVTNHSYYSYADEVRLEEL